MGKNTCQNHKRKQEIPIIVLSPAISSEDSLINHINEKWIDVLKNVKLFNSVSEFNNSRTIRMNLTEVESPFTLYDQNNIRIKVFDDFTDNPLSDPNNCIVLISLIENALAEYDPFVVSYIFTSYGFNEQNTISFFTGHNDSESYYSKLKPLLKEFCFLPLKPILEHALNCGLDYEKSKMAILNDSTLKIRIDEYNNHVKKSNQYSKSSRNLVKSYMSKEVYLLRKYYICKKAADADAINRIKYLAKADNYLVQQVKKTNNSTYIHFFANNFNQSLDTLLKLSKPICFDGLTPVEVNHFINEIKTNRNFINDIEIITDKNTDDKQLPVMKILEEELDESEYEHGRCNNILILKAN